MAVHEAEAEANARLASGKDNGPAGPSPVPLSLSPIIPYSPPISKGGNKRPPSPATSPPRTHLFSSPTLLLISFPPLQRRSVRIRGPPRSSHATRFHPSRSQVLPRGRPVRERQTRGYRVRRPSRVVAPTGTSDLRSMCESFPLSSSLPPYNKLRSTYCCMHSTSGKVIVRKVYPTL